MEALGHLDEAEQAVLEAHLATCEECRATSAELTSTVEALDALTRGAVCPPVSAVPPAVAPTESGGHRTNGVGYRGKRIRRGLIAGVSIAAVVIAAMLVTTLVNRSDLPTKTVALRGGPGVTATAVLVEKPWGTSLTIREQGLVPGHIYTVSMANLQGRWWTAGSYRATSSTFVAATMVCAAQFDSIDRIRVTDSSGRTVLTDHSIVTY
jgi:hypothetical protein